MKQINIRTWRESKGYTQEELSEETGIPRGRIAQWENRGSTPKHHDFEKLRMVLGDVTNVTDPEEFNEPKATYRQKRMEKKNSSSRPGVPVVGGFTTAGNITVYNDEGLKSEIIATLPPNIFPNCDHAEKAKGDSMYPLIMNQALLVGKRCSPKGIVYGEKYIIKTKDGMDTVKFIHAYRDDENKKIAGKLLLVAHNKSIPPQEIDIEDITFACRVLWIVNPT